MTNQGIFIFTLITVFFTTVLATKRLIPVLLRKKIGQKILDIGPSWHGSKNGTPTMGGLGFVIATLGTFIVAIILFGNKLEKSELYCMINVLTYGMLNAVIGMIDDLAKIRKKENEGLTPKGKLILQSVAAVLFLVLMRQTVINSPVMKIPFADFELELGIFYYIVAFFLLCGVTNAVNLTDGIDGLASTCVLTVGALISVVGISIEHNSSLVFFGGVLVGATIGFLIFNFYPAKIFMGDTGSLFLGSIVVGVSFINNNPLLVLIYGFVFIVEALSVILQVVYFKLTKGKRLFKMAPLHHHFEKCGFSEVKVVSIFGIISAVFCTIAYFGF